MTAIADGLGLDIITGLDHRLYRHLCPHLFRPPAPANRPDQANRCSLSGDKHAFPGEPDSSAETVVSENWILLIRREI
jgi:hypothetical protein